MNRRGFLTGALRTGIMAFTLSTGLGSIQNIMTRTSKREITWRNDYSLTDNKMYIRADEIINGKHFNVHAECPVNDNEAKFNFNGVDRDGISIKEAYVAPMQCSLDNEYEKEYGLIT